MRYIKLSIPDRLGILKALSPKTGLIDTILVGLIREKIQFTPEEIEYAGLVDGLKGAVTYDVNKPINRSIPFSEVEARLLSDRFGSTAEYEGLKSRIVVYSDLD